MVWSKLKFVFFKLKIGMVKIFVLEKEHNRRGRIRLKSDKIEKILIWPLSQDHIVIRAFLGTI